MDKKELMIAKLERVRQTSPKMRWIISAIVQQDWGVVAERASGGMSITSDGHVVSGGVYIGSAGDFVRNVKGYVEAAELTKAEKAMFQLMYAKVVRDWRNYSGVVLWEHSELVGSDGK